MNSLRDLASQGNSDSDCPYCGQAIAPMLFDESGQATDNRAIAAYIIPRAFCTCEAGRKQHEREEAARERADWLSKARMVIEGLDLGEYGNFRFTNWNDNRYPGAGEYKTQILAWIDHIINDRTQRWLYIHGPYGVGKTHLAVAALRKIAAEKLWKPNIVLWPAHCFEIQDSWGDNSGGAKKTASQLWQAMKHADVLLIDDLDKTSTDAWAMKRLFEVIDRRVLRRRVTILTANRSLQQLRAEWSAQGSNMEDLGMAVLSRISGQLSAQIFMEGQDQRWG